MLDASLLEFCSNFNLNEYRLSRIGLVPERKCYGRKETAASVSCGRPSVRRIQLIFPISAPLNFLFCLLLVAVSHKRMKETQDWGAVWSGPKSFHPSVVPFPIRQGYVRAHSKVLPPPDGYGNAELMKIPNFLHLTPPAVKKQCEAIKRFCTPWPENLETDAKCEHHFPIEFITSDYCHGLPTIRNPLARIIALQVRRTFLASPFALTPANKIDCNPVFIPELD